MIMMLLNCVKYARSMEQILQCGFSYDKDDTGKLFCPVCEDKEKYWWRIFVSSREYLKEMIDLQLSAGF